MEDFLFTRTRKCRLECSSNCCASISGWIHWAFAEDSRSVVCDSSSSAAARHASFLESLIRLRQWATDGTERKTPSIVHWERFLEEEEDASTNVEIVWLWAFSYVDSAIVVRDKSVRKSTDLGRTSPRNVWENSALVRYCWSRWFEKATVAGWEACWQPTRTVL